VKVKVEAIAAIAAAATLAVAVPAAAHPGPGDHHSGSSHSQATEHSKRSEHSRKCMAHHPAFVESGTVDSTTPSTLAKNADGTWSGTLVLDVTRTNHWARADKSKTVTYTFTNAKLTVKFDNGTTGFTAGERVKLIGHIAAEGRHCTSTGTAAAPEFRMVTVHPVRSTDSTSSSSDNTENHTPPPPGRK